MSYYLEPKADIGGFECNIWRFSFLMEALELLGADLADSSMMNDGQGVAKEHSSAWGKLLSTRKTDLMVADVVIHSGKVEASVPLLKKWSEEEVLAYLMDSQGIVDRFQLKGIHPLADNDLEMVDRFSKFLMECEGYSQY